MSLQPQLQMLRDALEECERCAGVGWYCVADPGGPAFHKHREETCATCNGSGKWVRPSMEALYRVVVEECSRCRGLGKIPPKTFMRPYRIGQWMLPEDPCSLCNGHKYILRTIWDAPDMEWALWGALCGATMSLEPVLVGLNRKLVDLPYASWVSIAVAALEAVAAALKEAT